ncbi:EcoKI restriction-modification system protein HsdS [compost metagenome]
MAKQTTGIATINMTQLKSFIVFIPPIELQNRFEQLVKTIEAKKQLMNAQLLQLESNFQALLQKAFKGELKVKDGVAV